MLLNGGLNGGYTNKKSRTKECFPIFNLFNERMKKLAHWAILSLHLDAGC
jgi:hypothetical protein